MANNLFGVFDGATSLAKEDAGLKNGETGGRLAATAARDVFAKNHYPLTDLGVSANTAIMEKMAAHGVNQSRPENIWSTSAAVVRISENQMEWFQTGDANILVFYEDGTHQILGSCLDHDYETLVMMKQARNNTLANPDLFSQVLRVRSGMNHTYGVLNGDDRAPAFANSGRTGLDRVETVLLFTDGLSLPAPDPERTKDFSPLAAAFRELGLHGLHRRIRHLEKSDPHRRHFPRFKCHDDIAAIAVHPRHSCTKNKIPLHQA